MHQTDSRSQFQIWDGVKWDGQRESRLLMFDRFTDRSRRILVLAQEEVRMRGDGFMGTEHLLIGMLHEDESVAAKALQEIGVTTASARQAVDALVGPGGGAVERIPSPPFTPRCKKVLELGLREALQLGHSYVAPEHLLLGLIREGEGVAARALVSLGVGLAQTRQAIIRILAGRDVVKTPPPPESSRVALQRVQDAMSAFVRASTRDMTMIAGLERKVDLAESAKNGAYRERDRLVCVLSRLWPSHIALHKGEWDDEWRNIVCVHAPTGQLTWHIHDSELPMFEHLSVQADHWDGHTTAEKYQRLEAWRPE